MEHIKNQVETFLRQCGMHYEAIDIHIECARFMEEMKRGLLCDDASLAMITTYIGLEKEIPADRPVVVIDAGGTNCRIALVSFDAYGRPIIMYSQMHPMPGSLGEIDKAEFYKTLVGYLSPVIQESDRIGFCFSYPTEILPNKDGRLKFFNKEVRVKDMCGELVGNGLKLALRNAGIAGDKKVIMLNDTVATLLGGQAACPGREFDTYIGFILGTGFNTCYAERNINIKKTRDLAETDGYTLVNMEAGGYALAPRGSLDALLDEQTVNPGVWRFEKMISGAYQGSLMRLILQKAARDGMFYGETADALLQLKSLETKDMTDYINYPYKGDNPLSACVLKSTPPALEENAQKLYYLLDAFYERIARLITFELSAVVLKTGKGSNPCRPVSIVAEGTTFYKSRLLRDKLAHYLKLYLQDQHGIYYEFVKADNVTLVGTAIAGLLN